MLTTWPAAAAVTLSMYKRSFQRARGTSSLVTIESRFPPHGGLGLSVPLLALSDNQHSRCAAISEYGTAWGQERSHRDQREGATAPKIFFACGGRDY